MNHTYRLVWNHARCAWVACAENARGHGKSRRARVLTATALSLSLALAHSAPQDAKVVAGTATVTRSGATTTVQQASPTALLNWSSFNVAAQESVNFVQPGAAAIAVNRIADVSGSQILGRLSANGQVWLINPNGVMFGPGARVDVGGLVASTLDVSEGSLGNSQRSFQGAGKGSVVNLGNITTPDSGYVALLGNQVRNQGVITAQRGTVALGGGSAVTLTFKGTGLAQMQVDESVLNSLAENGQLIRADGGQVLMLAGARDSLLASVVNNTGIIGHQR